MIRDGQHLLLELVHVGAVDVSSLVHGTDCVFPPYSTSEEFLTHVVRRGQFHGNVTQESRQILGRTQGPRWVSKGSYMHGTKVRQCIRNKR